MLSQSLSIPPVSHWSALSSPHSAPPFNPTRLKGGADVCAASYGAFVNSGEDNNPEDEERGAFVSAASILVNYGSPNPSIFSLSFRNSFYSSSSFPSSPWDPLFPLTGSESPIIPMLRAPVIQISRRALLISSLPKSCGGVPFLVLRDRERD